MVHLFLTIDEAVPLLELAQRAGLVPVIESLRQQIPMARMTGEIGEPAISVYRAGVCVDTFDERLADAMYLAMQAAHTGRVAVILNSRAVDAIAGALTPITDLQVTMTRTRAGTLAKRALRLLEVSA